MLSWSRVHSLSWSLCDQLTDRRVSEIQRRIKSLCQPKILVVKIYKKVIYTNSKSYHRVKCLKNCKMQPQTNQESNHQTQVIWKMKLFWTSRGDFNSFYNSVSFIDYNLRLISAYRCNAVCNALSMSRHKETHCVPVDKKIKENDTCTKRINLQGSLPFIPVELYVTNVGTDLLSTL